MQRQNWKIVIGIELTANLKGQSHEKVYEIMT
jgi:hypothetical protein